METVVNQLLDQLYQCIADPDQIPDFFEELCDKTGSHSVHIGAFQNLPDGSVETASSFVSYTSPDIQPHIRHYLVDGVSANPRLPLVAPALKSGMLVYANEVIPFKDVRDTDFYKLWQAPIDGVDIAGVCFYHDKRTTVLGEFYQGEGDFTPQAREIFRELAPHLSRLYTIRKHLGEVDLQRQAVWDVLDKQQHGVMLLNFRGKALFANRAAKSIADGGGILQFRNGKLFLRDQTARHHYESLVNQLILGCGHPGAVSGPIVVTRGLGCRPIQILVTPLGATAASLQSNTPVMAVFLFDPEIPIALSVRQLIELYNLTPGEAQVALLIAQGLPLEACAHHLGHRVSTSRNLLKRVFEKTGTGKQHELTSELLRHSLPVTTNH